jgi:hypothetical protein
MPSSASLISPALNSWLGVLEAHPGVRDPSRQRTAVTNTCVPRTCGANQNIFQMSCLGRAHLKSRSCFSRIPWIHTHALNIRAAEAGRITIDHTQNTLIRRSPPPKGAPIHPLIAEAEPPPTIWKCPCELRPTRPGAFRKGIKMPTENT